MLANVTPALSQQIGTPLALPVYVVEVLSRASTSRVLPTTLHSDLWVRMAVWLVPARSWTHVLQVAMAPAAASRVVEETNRRWYDSPDPRPSGMSLQAELTEVWERAGAATASTRPAARAS